MGLPLSAGVDDEFALVVGERLIVNHAFDGVRLEVAQILVDESVILDVGILPLAVSPGREPARTRAHLSRSTRLSLFRF